MTKPKLLMVDEMSLGLAPIIVERLLPVLRQIAIGTGVGVLVEQRLNLVLEVADRAYVLSHVDLVLEGAESHLRANQQLLGSSYLGGARFDDVHGAADSTSTGEVTTDGLTPARLRS